ncbi:MAG: hypothetical protein E7378_02620 [Clostridiales bacterium]|nr:hypothetical protein [Clostridiales bacterium]
MDNKQKKSLFKKAHALAAILLLVDLAWIFYFSISKLVSQQNNVLYLDIGLLTISTLILFFVFANINKTAKMKNLYKVCLYCGFVCFITLSSVVACLVYMNFNNSIDFTREYFLLVLCLSFAIMLMIIMCFASVKISNFKGSKIIDLDTASEVPKFDDELELKKKLDELKRKLEMKKVVDQIKDMENQLEE